MRLSSSQKHLNKLVDILVKIIVSNRHPEWIQRAITWLTAIVREPSLCEMIKECAIPLQSLISYANESRGVNRILKLACESDNMEKNINKHRKRPANNNFVTTGYVYIDDSDENFGIPLKRKNKSPDDQIITINQNDVESENLSDSELSVLSESEENEENSNDSYSADDGVFDVEDETSISDNQLATQGMHISTREINNSENSEDESSDELNNIEINSNEVESDQDPSIRFSNDDDDDDDDDTVTIEAQSQLDRINRIKSLRSTNTNSTSQHILSSLQSPNSSNSAKRRRPN